MRVTRQYLKTMLCYRPLSVMFLEDPDEGGGGPGEPLINPDGTFNEGWTSYLEEGLRGEESLKVITSLNGMAKSYVNAEKQRGRDANKVAIPGKNATPQEIESFYSMIGRPKTPEEYQSQIPQELSEIFTDEAVKEAREFAHKIGATQQQFEAYMQREVERAKEILASQEPVDPEAAKQQCLAELQKRFGGAMDERKHLANLMLDQVPDLNLKLRLLQNYGNDPDFIEMLSHYGVKMAEHKAIIAEVTKQTPVELESKMNELRHTPGYILPDPKTGKYLRDTDPDRYNKITKDIADLVKQAYPDARERANVMPL